MIEEIAPLLYRVEVPLPNNPLKSVNSYFIKAQDRNLIIDTGMNLPQCRDAMVSAVAKLKIDLNHTDFFITHFHADHLDLTPQMATKTSKVYLNEKEAAFLVHPENWDRHRLNYLKHGFPENEMQAMEQNQIIQGRRLGEFRLDFVIIKEKDVLHVGEYSFRFVETPGHTPGHTCLYEPDKKILVSGDHILFDITPNITSWPDMENSLYEYLINLDKIYSLEVKLVLPGHRSTGSNHRKRILELKIHHRARANEILMFLSKEGKTAYQVAPLVKWDVNYKSWEQFPTPQKFFAFGEVIAHLKYLEGEGEIQSAVRNGQIVFYHNENKL